MLAVTLCAVGALLASYVAIVSTSASAADTLLSHGKPATASSVENAGTSASAAVDGDLGTRWSSKFEDPQWLQVDLGVTATISQVVLRWEAAYASAFQIQTSPDGNAPWTFIYSTTTSTGGRQTLNVSGTGRFVRVYTTARATVWGYSLWEFQVYGSTGSVGCDTAGNAALNRPATASSTQNAGFPASSAVDGNAGTRWSSAAADPQWIQIDLGTSRSICQVVLVWETAYGSSYQIQTSPDGNAPWTSLYSTTTSTGGTQTLSVTGTGRYVRVYGTARSTQWGYSLWELIVHTSGSPTTSPSTSPSNPTGDVLLSYNKPGVASTSQDDVNCFGCTPAKAFDLDPASRWATSSTTGWVDPGWMEVLGRNTTEAYSTLHAPAYNGGGGYGLKYTAPGGADLANGFHVWAVEWDSKGMTFRLDDQGRLLRQQGDGRDHPWTVGLRPPVLPNSQPRGRW